MISKSCLGLLQEFLRAGFEAKQRYRDRQVAVIREMHERRNHTSVVCRDTTVVPKKYLRVNGKRGQIDLVIHKRSTSIHASRQRETCLRARSVASIVENNVDGSIHRIDGHPGEKLHLAVLDRIVVHAHRTGPRITAIS